MSDWWRESKRLKRTRRCMREEMMQTEREQNTEARTVPVELPDAAESGLSDDQAKFVHVANNVVCVRHLGDLAQVDRGVPVLGSA